MKNYNRLLLILKYLHDKTDEDHSVSIKGINEYLAKQNLDADRKTISECISELINVGYDICCIRSTQNLYYMHSRPFTLAEVKVLVDAVQSSRFISEKHSRELIEKLSTLVGTYKGDILKRQLYIGSRVKADNVNLPYNVEMIQKAIIANRKISFCYFDYNAQKEKVLKQDGKIYVFSPLSLIWNNDMYYVVGCGDYYKNKVLKFRLDRMTDLEILDSERVDAPNDFSVSDFFDKEFSMMGGNVSTVELLCENELMDSVIDKFGEGVKTEIIDSEHFKATVDVKVSGLFFGWVLASRGAMRILGPEDVVEKFNELITKYL
jgi:predicted DNA-binding transcriptional regulator YafY